ncbi:MAG: bifunctional alpha,alpha-trehalose-phosphate synthase (UDP-forming)/trehalose-phosphatase [Planctomycetota bacterium]
MSQPSETPIAESPGRTSPRPLWIASNRLPVSLGFTDGELHATRSSGGLAAAMKAVAEGAPLDWVGWPGCPVPTDRQDEVRDRLAAERLVPVFLDEEDEELYYHGIANQAIWPLFHYFVDKVDFQERAWQRYVEVNQRFAETILTAAPEGARIWIHDFHLMLVPRLLRQARPDLEIGFFLHIPFPSSEIYRLLPAREDLLLGVLGCDYVGFHTHDYARHFRSACLRVLGLTAEHDGVRFEGRRVGIGVHPIGIDVQGFERTLTAPRTAELVAELEDRYRGRRLILGVERLDYTKGVAHKLRAFERVLERRPSLASEVALLQVIVPSRLKNPDYAALKREIDECVGRLNGRYGSPGVTPVEYMHRSVDPEQLAALYRFADVCLVTPVRDGMNLVAQEFVLCQDEVEGLDEPWRGMLVLSEFAGAAHVLARALLVNPWDLEQSADLLEDALDMPPGERAERMQTMADQVRALECTTWARHFLERQGAAADANQSHAVVTFGREDEAVLCREFAAASRRVLFLDYDGTLREIVRSPEDAVPSAELLEVLAGLSSLPDTEIHIVSGRHRRDLEHWLGGLDLSLCAEHGFAWRPRGAHTWQENPGIDLSWLPRVRSLLRGVTDEVPGTRLEVKPCALAWHYRMADADYGAWRARELHSQLQHNLANLPAEIVHGHRVIEVRAAGVHKGSYVSRHVEGADWILCVGDDRTDLDMYRALPAEAHSIHVGVSVAEAQYTIPSPAHVRRLLARLLAAAEAAD